MCVREKERKREPKRETVVGKEREGEVKRKRTRERQIEKEI